MFSYFEHDWDESIDGPDEITAELMRRVIDGEWMPYTGHFPHSPDTDTIERLEAIARECLADWDVPDDAVRIPIEKLRAVIDAGGWTFVTGSFIDFEGHHNDTEYLAQLTRER